jgi:hypothetical protein
MCPSIYPSVLLFCRVPPRLQPLLHPAVIALEGDVAQQFAHAVAHVEVDGDLGIVKLVHGEG